MAYNTTTNYKNNIYDENSEQVIDIIINGTTINRDYIKSFKLSDEIFESDTFSLGSAITSKITLELDNSVYSDISSNFDGMTIVFRLITELGQEVVQMGRYLVKEKDDSSSEYTKFILYDYMDKFDVEFDASQIVPCTRFELLQAICDYCGVELSNTSILNGNIKVGVYDSSITAKTYLSLISERAGGFAKINRNNKLVIKTLSDVDTVEIPENKMGDYTKDDLKTITKIVYENATQKFEKGTDDGGTVYLSQDSPFSCTQAEVDNIYNKLNGLSYQSLEVRVWGDPSIDTGDIIKFGNIKTFAQKEWSFGNGFYGKYKTVLKDSKSSLQVTKIPNKSNKKKLESRIDEAEGKITLLNEEVTENKEKTNILEMTVDQTKQTISKVETTVEEIKTTTQTSEGGNHLYLKKVLEQDALEYYIKGKSEQDTRSGKNYIDSSKFIAKSSNGMTALSNEDGSIKFSGTTTNLTNFWFNELNEKLKAGTYKFVTNVDLTNKGRYTLIDNTSGSNVTIINHTKTNSFTISEDMTLTTILIQINADITLNNDFYIMLINDSETEDYEKYGSSPNPKYPSEIKSIAQNGIAKLRITGKNLLNAPYNKENKLTRTATKNDDYQSTDFFAELEAGKQYTFSCKTTGTFGIGNSYQTECYLLLDKKYGYILSMGNKDKYTFTVNQSGKFYLRTDVNIKGETHSFFDFQIEEGEEVTTYEEYKEKEVLIDLNKYDDDGNIVGNYELSSLPNGTSNDLNIVDGQVVLTQNIEKIVLNGSESWIKDSIPKESPRWYCKNYNALMVTPINNDTKAVALSNIGIVSATDTAFETANGLAIHPNGSIYISLDAKILLDNSEEITLYYELKEPKQIVLPNIQIPIFEGVNHVSLVDDIETNTSIKFLCENPYSEYYALNKDLDKTNSNLSNTNHQLGQAQSDINATNTHLNNDFYDKNQIDSMQTSTEQLITQIKNQVEMTTNSTNLQISVLQEKLINGITSVVTETGYKFDKDGLSISKTGEPMKSVLDNEGLIVYRDTTIKLKVSGDEVYTDNLIVNTYFIQKPIRREQGVSISDGKSIGVVEHWIGSGN